ncbi:SRPBCC family protein [Jatrophihabitans fulvus]
MARGTATVVVPGPRERVFALFADRENYGDLVAPVSCTLVRVGRTERQGVGAVHRIGVGPAGLREEIVALEPGRSFTYKAVTPLPVKHWIGTVEFHDHPKGTRVDYSLDIEGFVPLPAPVVKAAARGLAAGLARGVAKRVATEA